MTLGERIRELRKGRHWTLQDLSKASALSVPYLSDIENDKVNPSIDVVIRLADTFEMYITTLLDPVAGLGALNGSLQRFIQEDLDFGSQVNTAWLQTLMRIEYKGKRPASKQQWLEVFLFLRRHLAPEEIENR